MDGWMNLMSYLRWNRVVHVSTFLMITLAVLATRHLPFAAPALLVDAATFTRTLERRESWIMTWFASQVIYLQLTDTAEIIFFVSICLKCPRVICSPFMVVCDNKVVFELTPVALGFLDTLRPFSGFSGRHSSSTSSSSSLGDISSSMSMVVFCGAFAVVKRLPLGFKHGKKRKSTSGLLIESIVWGYMEKSPEFQISTQKHSTNLISKAQHFKTQRLYMYCR